MPVRLVQEDRIGRIGHVLELGILDVFELGVTINEDEHRWLGHVNDLGRIIFENLLGLAQFFGIGLDAGHQLVQRALDVPSLGFLYKGRFDLFRIKIFLLTGEFDIGYAERLEGIPACITIDVQLRVEEKRTENRITLARRLKGEGAHATYPVPFQFLRLRLIQHYIALTAFELLGPDILVLRLQSIGYGEHRESECQKHPDRFHDLYFYKIKKICSPHSQRGMNRL